MKKKLFEPKVVQFFHSGSEFPQKKIDETHKHKPWSVNSHTRNFIKCKGEYVDKSGRKKQGTLVFWGEWEAEADVVEFYESAGLLPKRLISPTYKQKYPSGSSSCVNKTGCGKKKFLSTRIHLYLANVFGIQIVNNCLGKMFFKKYR